MQGYGGAPMQTYAQPGAPAQGGMMAQVGQAMASGGQAGTRPTTRNPLITFLLPVGCIFGGAIIAMIFGIIAGIAGVGAIALIGTLFNLVALIAGAFFAITSIIKMVGEINSVTKNNFAWWMTLIPVYGIAILLPQEVAKAKQAAGVQEPTRSLVMYLFLGLYALAADVNDIAARMR
jgi:hypothetical protein